MLFCCMTSTFGYDAKEAWKSLSMETKQYWTDEARKLNLKIKADKDDVEMITQKNVLGPYGSDDKHCPVPFRTVYADLSDI